MRLILSLACDDAELRPDGKLDIQGVFNELTIQGHTEVHAAGAGAPATTRLVMPLERVVFPHPGAYRFLLSARGQEVEGIPMHVVEVEGGNRPGGRG